MRTKIAVGRPTFTPPVSVTRNETNSARPPLHAVAECKRILYVDDDPTIRILGARLLSRLGYVVVTAANGAEAWAALNREDFQLLITDHNMPVMTGLELITQARRAGMKLPVVIASGSATAVRDRFSAALRVTACLDKPFGAEALRETVDRVLHPGAPTPRSERKTIFPVRSHRNPALSRPVRAAASV